MVDRIEMMTMRNVGVMPCRFVSTLFVMLGRFLMMLRSLLMMFSGLLVVLRTYVSPYLLPSLKVKGTPLARNRRQTFTLRLQPLSVELAGISVLKLRFRFP
jgi:hypothetical protein